MIESSPKLMPVKRMLAAMAASLVALVVLLVSPIRRFRFAIMPVDEIGPLARNPHHYLWQRAHKTAHVSTRDIWVCKPTTFVCNELVLNKWRQHLSIKRSWLSWYVFRFVTFVSPRRHTFTFERRWSKLPSRSYPFILSLSSDEQVQFRRETMALGLKNDVPHVVFCVRDDAYKQTERREPLAYDSRESYRNHDIDDFREAALAVVADGAFVLRMGVKVRKSFKLGSAGVIDYATSGLRTELSDLGLLSTAKLCVSTSLGIDQIAGLSGVSRCVVNFFPTQNVVSFYPWDTLIFQRIRERRTGRELSLRESLDFLANYPFTQTADLDSNGLELIRNTPSEIREAVVEALRRDASFIELPKADTERQSRFWEILADATGDRSFGIEMRPRIGVSFLKRYESILE